MDKKKKIELTPEKWDLRISKNVILKTVSFVNSEFEIYGNRYKITATQVVDDINSAHYKDSIHTVTNMKTNEKREVYGYEIRKWIDK